MRAIFVLSTTVVRCPSALVEHTPRETVPFSDSVLPTRNPTIAYLFLSPSFSLERNLPITIKASRP